MYLTSWNANIRHCDYKSLIHIFSIHTKYNARVILEELIHLEIIQLEFKILPLNGPLGATNMTP